MIVVGLLVLPAGGVVGEGAGAGPAVGWQETGVESGTERRNRNKLLQDRRASPQRGTIKTEACLLDEGGEIWQPERWPG